MEITWILHGITKENTWISLSDSNTQFIFLKEKGGI